VHNVSQRPNLRHLGEPQGGAECLLNAASLTKATESVRGRRIMSEFQTTWTTQHGPYSLWRVM